MPPVQLGELAGKVAHEISREEFNPIGRSPTCLRVPNGGATDVVQVEESLAIAAAVMQHLQCEQAWI